MTNNELFLNLYNTLDELLKDKYQVEDYSYSVINRRVNELKGSYLNKLKERGERLDIIRNIRNNLVHLEKYQGQDNFIITDYLIRALKEEIEDVKDPLTAIKVCKKQNEVLCTTLNEKVKIISKKMLELGYTHIPVIENGYLYGVFSQTTLFSSILKENDIHVDKNLKVSDLSEFLPISKHTTEKFLFVDKNFKSEDLLPLFLKKELGKRLVMVFVTENGKQNEKILGIITPYDLFQE